MTFSRRVEATCGRILAALPTVQSHIETYTQLNYFECIAQIVEHSLNFDVQRDAGAQPPNELTVKFPELLERRTHWSGGNEDLVMHVLQLLEVGQVLSISPKKARTSFPGRFDLGHFESDSEFADDIPSLLIELLKKVGIGFEETYFDKEVIIDVDQEENIDLANDVDFAESFFGFPEKYAGQFGKEGWTPWSSFYQTLIFRSVIPKPLRLQTYHTMVKQKYDFRKIAAHFPFKREGEGIKFANPIPPYFARRREESEISWPKASEPWNNNVPFPFSDCIRLSCPHLGSKEPLVSQNGWRTDIGTLLTNETGKFPEAAARSRYWETQLCELFTKVVHSKSMKELEDLGLYVEVEETRSGLLQVILIISLWPNPPSREDEEGVRISLLAKPQPVCCTARTPFQMVPDCPEIYWVLRTSQSPGLPSLGHILPLLASISSLSWISSSIIPSRKEVYFSGPEHFLIETVFPIPIEVRNFCRRQDFQTEIDLLISKIRAHSPSFNDSSHTCSSLRSIRPAQSRGESR
jgi:hypothetical protein